MLFSLTAVGFHVTGSEISQGFFSTNVETPMFYEPSVQLCCAVQSEIPETNEDTLWSAQELQHLPWAFSQKLRTRKNSLALVSHKQYQIEDALWINMIIQRTPGYNLRFF